MIIGNIIILNNDAVNENILLCSRLKAPTSLNHNIHIINNLD